jgi:hypothetical protein
MPTLLAIFSAVLDLACRQAGFFFCQEKKKECKTILMPE